MELIRVSKVEDFTNSFFITKQISMRRLMGEFYFHFSIGIQ